MELGLLAAPAAEHRPPMRESRDHVLLFLSENDLLKQQIYIDNVQSEAIGQVYIHCGLYEGMKSGSQR